MESDKDNALLSDTEGGERPVREQLRKAHITSNPNATHQDVLLADASSEHSNGRGASDEIDQRGRLHRKRSHEEVDNEDIGAGQESSKHHTRKRSRDSTFEEDQLNNGQRKVSGERSRTEDETQDPSATAGETNGVAKPPRASTPETTGEKRSEAAVEAMASPKTKRSRLHSTTADAESRLADGNAAGGSTESGKRLEEAVSDDQSLEAPSKESDSTTKVPPTSGFANTSAVSPFGSFAGSKSPPSHSTSSVAFAASGFSALSGSSTSGFGAVGKQSGGFGSGGSLASEAKDSSDSDNSKAAPVSSFGGALGSRSAFSTPASGLSGFGSDASGFGKVGSIGGFGSGLGGTGFSSLGGGGGGLSSFASGKPVAPLGVTSKSAKPFGAPVDDDDAENDGDDDVSGAKSPLATEEEKQDERFYEQEHETGEEDEITEFSARAKLYNFALIEAGKKEWRERGLGVLRFNVRKSNGEHDSKPRGRLLIRADGSHRVVLNTPVTKDIKFGAPNGGPPQGGYMYFMGTIDGKAGLELLQLKMKQANALDLHERITTLQEEM